MPEYIVTASVANVVVNAEQVRKGALEGRNVIPLVETLDHGAKVTLSEDDAKRYEDAGALAKPGEAEEQRKAELQSELDRIQAQQDALEAQRRGLTGQSSEPQTSPEVQSLVDDNDADSLRDMAAERNLPQSGSKRDLAERIVSHDQG